MSRRRPGLAAGVLAICVLGPAVSPIVPAQDAPLALGLEDRVDVQLVLVDAVVLDPAGRTDGTLTRDDFALRVAGRPTELVSLDLHCPDGGAADPPGGSSAPGPAEPHDDGTARQIVLVFDYYHIQNASRSIEAAMDALRRHRRGGERHMVFSLGPQLRLESPLGEDPRQTLDALERMRTDATLYAGANDSLTGFPFFERMELILEILERIPERKVVVLFSGPFKTAGFLHDESMRRLASLAARSRASIYSIDSGGLRTLLDPDNSRLGGPALLRRISLETGGRPSADSNDLTLAYARAQRDLGCTYTLGFHDDGPRWDKERQFRVDVNRPGYRVNHAASYVLRSPETRRRASFAAAAMLPELYDSTGLAGRLILVRPLSARRWSALVALTLEPERALEPGAAAGLTLQATLRKPNGTIIDQRRRPLRPARNLTALEATAFYPLRAAPGRYSLSLIVDRAGSQEPRALSLQIELPEIPQDRPFLVGPLPVRRSDLAANESGALQVGETVWEPLVGPAERAVDTIAALTRVCAFGTSSAERLERVVTRDDGAAAVRFPSQWIHARERGGIDCEVLLDALPELEPGEYEILVSSSAAGSRIAADRARFTVAPGEDAAKTVGN